MSPTPGISSALAIINMFGGDINKMHLLTFNRLVSNLTQMYVNHQWTEEEWAQLLKHVAFPEDNEWPLKDKPFDTYPGYTNAMAAAYDIYEEL